MKLKEYITTVTETIEQEKQIDVIAEKLSVMISVVISKIESSWDLERLVDHPIYLPITDFAGPTMLGSLFDELSDLIISIKGIHTATNSPAAFNLLIAEDGTVIRMIQFTHWINDHTPIDSDLLHSALVHELRHALDHSLSKGKGMGKTRAKHTNPDLEKEKDHSVEVGQTLGDYYRMPTEINARVSQAMLDVKRSFEPFLEMVDENRDRITKEQLTTVANAYVSQLVPEVMKFHNLEHIFKKKGYRKVVNRLVKYAISLVDDDYEDNRT